jgi:translation initiation factor IF-3
LRVNREIRVPKVRVIGPDGVQIGILDTREALERAQQLGLDLVEVVANATPPVCKIIKYGKFRFEQEKRDKQQSKESKKKAQKLKEIKVKLNIGDHDLETKLRHARKFLEEGDKVKVTCMFRGREMARPELGDKLMQKICDELKELAVVEVPPKRMGRFITLILAPSAKKKNKLEEI